MTIVLQASAKLELLSMAVAMEGAVNATSEAFGVLLRPMYWTLVCALVFNTVYPAVLLHSKRRFLQRDAVAVIDVLLDLIYLNTFLWSMLAANGRKHVFPTAPFLFASNLAPLARVVTTARAIETAALQRRSEEALSEDSSHQALTAARQRLPRWASAAFLVLGGLGCSAPFFMGSRDRYPFSNGDACRPCVCSDAAVLESCTIPATFGLQGLRIDGKGVRGIAPRAF
jgi:hypothetical protein